MVEYSSDVIEQFAERLYKEADSIVWNYTAAGFMLGGVAGFLVFAPFMLLLAIIPAVVAAVFCAIVARGMGQAAAFKLRLQAQQALCQVAIEKNTRVSGRSRVVP